MNNQFIYSIKTGLILLFLGIAMSLSAQSVTVTGVVKDQFNVGLIGVTIFEKGTTTGASTDFDGAFSITVSSEDAILVASCIGFKPQEIAVEKQRIINFTLLEDMETLEGVVAIGYGAVKKSDLTGSVSSVKIDDLPLKPASSIDGLLQGQSAGVTVVTSSDDPGAGASIRIRGGSSLNAGNDPLVVVDGFPIGGAGDLKQISPTDIESIEVLKDASASAIYGSRGANGVIMITTKKGAKNQLSINLTQQLTVSDFTSKLNLWRDPVLMAELSNESRLNGGFNPLYIGATASNGVYYPSVNELKDGSWPYFTKWDEIVFQTPIVSNTALSIRNQTDKTQFSLSGAYYSDKGVNMEDNYSKINVNLNVTHDLTDFFRVGANVIFSEGDRNNNGGLAYWRSPIYPVYNEDDPTKGYYMLGTQDYDHPVALTDLRTNTSDFLDVISSIFGELEIIKGLKLKSQLNYKFGRSIGKYYNPKKYTLDGVFNNGSAGISNWESSDLVTETFLTYDKTFNEKHKLNVMGGMSYQYYHSYASNLKAYDFLNESLGSGNIGVGNPEKQTTSNEQVETVMYSYMGRINYTYDNRYMATFTIRSDGSSKFGENNRWAIFPSGALGWKIHNEPFMRDQDVVDELKLRASYGISGNQGISPYLINSRYGTDQYYSNGGWNVSIGPGYTVGWDSHTGKRTWGGIPNPDLKWETTNQFNIGADFAFLNSRLRITADYYRKHTTDLLRERWLSPSSSYDRMWVNSGEIMNNGVELSIHGNIVDTPDWHFSANLIMSHNNNKVTSLGDAAAFGLSTDPNTDMKYEFMGNEIEMFRGMPQILGIGESVGVYYGYKVAGIVQTNEEGLSAGLEGSNALPGEYKYVDFNEDGVIDTNDRTIIGDPNPDFVGSLHLNLSWKNIDLSAMFYSSIGGDILNTQAFNGPDSQPFRWTMDNQTNDYPSLRDGRQVLLSDWWIEDGSYLRLQNLSLGYTLPSFGSKWFKGARIAANASNLFTLTNFKGYDPEVSTNGIYWGGYPKLRRFTFSVEFMF